MLPASPVAAGPEDVLEAWFAPPREVWQTRWFRHNDAFDALLRTRFAAVLDAARAGTLKAWADTPRGALALAIVLDQLPRNLYRGQAASFASDAKARAVADTAIAHGFHRQLAPEERMFLYLPFEHSEAIADQDRSVALFETFRGDPSMAETVDYARRHRAVIRRFGRFPHRNAALGRDSTAEERAFLAEHPEGL